MEVTLSFGDTGLNMDASGFIMSLRGAFVPGTEPPGRCATKQSYDNEKIATPPKTGGSQ